MIAILCKISNIYHSRVNGRRPVSRSGQRDVRGFGVKIVPVVVGVVVNIICRLHRPIAATLMSTVPREPAGESEEEDGDERKEDKARRKEERG